MQNRSMTEQSGAIYRDEPTPLLNGTKTKEEVFKKNRRLNFLGEFYY